MSYRCQITGKVSQCGEKLHKVVVATRPKNYTKWIRDEESHAPKWIEIPCSTGHEIVKELNCSAEGEALWLSWTSEERALFLKQGK
jgi:hypothetical protein